MVLAIRGVVPAGSRLRTACARSRRLWWEPAGWLLRVSGMFMVVFLVGVAVWYLRTVIRAKVNVHVGSEGRARAPLGAQPFDRASLKRRALYELDKPTPDRVNKPPPVEDFPRVIHQLWKTDAIPEQFQEAVSSCRRLNPNWEYRLWTDAAIDKFIASKYPMFYDRFVSYKYPIQRVDVARYFILLHYGGVTIDIDLKCRVPLDDILRDKAGYDLVVPETDPAGVTVEFMAAKSRGQFLRRVAFDLNQAPPDYIFPYITIIFSTGPMYLTNKLVDYPKYDEIFVIPQQTYREKYFRNLHGGSWHRWDYILIKILYSVVSPFSLVLITCLVCAAVVCRRSQKTPKHVSIV